MRITKHVRLMAAVLAVGGIAAAALWPETLAVDATAAARGTLEVTIDEDGETRVRDRFIVSAPLSGRLQRIELEPGDAVTRGVSIVARLLPLEPQLLDARTRAEFAAGVDAARAGVEQTRGERERAVAAAERAAVSARRQRVLLTAGAVSEDDLEAAETARMSADGALRAADAAVSRAAHELRLARARLDAPAGSAAAIDIVAPLDGVILRRARESASVVAAGEPLLEIGTPRGLELVSDLLSTDAVRVSAGQRVFIEHWGGSAALEGRVRLVEPSGFRKVSALGVDEQRVGARRRLSRGDTHRGLARGRRAQGIGRRPVPSRRGVGGLRRRGRPRAPARRAGGLAQQRRGRDHRRPAAG
jgi:HlyD family secretion protein